MVLDGCSVSASWPVSLAQLGNAPSSSWWAASSGLAWITGERVGCKLLESSEGISKPLAWSRQQFGFCSQVQNRSYQAQAVMWSCWKSPWFALECCKLHALHGFRTLPMENTGCHGVQEDRIDRLSLKASVCISPVRGKLWENCGSQQDKSSL